MFACKDLQVYTPVGKQRLLSANRVVFHEGKLNAVIGPSGCGKTTLIKGLMGILPVAGEIHYGGRLVENPELLRGQVGFAPQFSIAQSRLTVRESLSYALELLVADASLRQQRLQQILEATGLQEHAEKKIASLSGGQLRRIGLGLEMTTDPETLFCDEVTSGLDPLSEDQILAMLRRLSERKGKTFICVIHNLGKLDDFDWVTVVHQGNVVYQGTPDEVRAHFGIHDFLGLYEKLLDKSVDEWLQQWQATAEPSTPVVQTTAWVTPSLPSGMSQAWTLFKRRMLLFFRDRGTLLLTLAITVGFPCMVVIFSIGGLPQINALSMEHGAEVFARIQESIRYSKEALEVGGLVSGLIMFQVILLTLMGSNNGSREIAGERMLYEKERLSGVRPMSYVMAKTVFVSGLAIVQGVWMTIFVKAICQFPGSWITCSLVLVLVVLAMSILSLGFSAVFVSPEKASLLSIYLVGFQLPLSGVVLALPEYLVWVLRPLINAFWGWAGYLKTMQDTRWYDAVMMQDFGWLPEVSLSVLVLLIHTAVGFFLVVWGCQRRTAI